MTVGPVVVTGAAGLVGHGLAMGLMERGIDVLGVLRSRASGAFESVALDLETASVADACRGRAPLAIVHCAAAVPFPPDRPDNSANAALTRRIDAGVIKASAELGCSLFYISSCILYDPIDPAIKTERSHVRATTPYADAKLRGEVAARALPRAVIMRIPSPVSEPMGRGTVLERFLGSAVRGEPVEIWGSGEREQDFIHVADLAHFIARALPTDADGTFNVASGRPVSMRRLAETVVEVMGRGSVVVRDRPDPLEGHTARYDTQMARDRVGWSPEIDLQTMIARLWADQRGSEPSA